MAQGSPSKSATHQRIDPPFWSQALRALREARGITQEGWAAHLGYGRATIRRWEGGETVPSAEAESAIVALCREQRLFRMFTGGPLDGVTVSEEWIGDVLASARLRSDRASEALASSPKWEVPPVRYAVSDDVSIAYQIIGEGPVDIVVTPGAVSHREVEWEHPGVVAFFRELARFARVIVFDKRGTGMSDRVVANSLEQRMDDIRAVMDATDVGRAVLFGVSEGGPMSIRFASMHPERISRLVLYGTYDRITPPAAEGALSQLVRLRQVWGTSESPFLDRFAPSVASDPAARTWWARHQRMSASPGAVVSLNQMNADIDVRHTLADLQAPVLVLHRTGDLVSPLNEGRALARRIPKAQFVELPGEDHLPWIGDVKSITDEVRAFVEDNASEPEPNHILMTVMCVRFHDAPTPDEELANIVKHEIGRFQGIEIDTKYSYLVARFDSPSRALRCAITIRDSARVRDETLCCGVDAGEVRLTSGAANGAPIDRATELAMCASDGEVMVSEIVNSLASGSNLQWEPIEASREAGMMRALRLL